MNTNTILITDAVGLVGLYVINSLLSNSAFKTPSPQIRNVILAGYHSESELTTAKAQNAHPEIIKPILVDWENKATYADAVRNANAILLLTPFTSKKAAYIKDWLDAITSTRHEPKQEISSSNTANSSSIKNTHIVHVGVHTNPTIPSPQRPAHESWNLDAESAIHTASTKTSGLTYTHLRINFDGYNTLLKPGKIAYYLPTDIKYGWIAREDIADFAATVLLSTFGTGLARPLDSADRGNGKVHTHPHHGEIYPLSTTLIALETMSSTASTIASVPITAESLPVSSFLAIALSAPPGDRDEGYAEYVRSVAGMFEGLARGEFAWHREVYEGVFENVVGRKAMGFGEWLRAREGMMEKLRGS